MRKFFVFVFCLINSICIHGQINELFPNTRLGMTTDEFRINYINNSSIQYGNFEEFSSGRINGFIVYNIKIFDYNMIQEYHFLDGRLVGCTSVISFSVREFGHPDSYWFESLFNEFIIKFVNIYSNQIDIYNDTINDNRIPINIPEIVLGHRWENNLFHINVKSIDVNNNILFIAKKQIRGQYFPDIDFIYGTSIFYNEFLGILLNELQLNNR